MRSRFVKLSVKDIQRYNVDGVVCLRNVFNSTEINLVKEGIEYNMSHPSIHHDWLTNHDNIKDGEKKAVYFNDYMNYDKISQYWSYVTTSPAASISGQLMRSQRSLFFHEHVFYKQGGSTRATPWHHDQPYYPIDGIQNCTVWMPVTSVDKKASLKFLSGSHLWKDYFIPRKFSSNKEYETSTSTNYNVPDSNYSYVSLPEESDKMKELMDENGGELLSWHLEPGDAICFNMKTLHGTDANSYSDENRMVMASRWLGDDCVFVERPWETSPPSELLKRDLNLGEKVIQSSKAFPVLWEQSP
jgi:ectoine hydroxylase-related dioxygenase (phytanoyl-CoA dioxygenase family)